MNTDPNEPGSAALPPEGSTISLSQLKSAGFSEDRKALRAFERKYLPVTLPAVLLTFGSLFVLVKYPHLWGVVGFVVGCAICQGASMSAARATPVSRSSGKPMIKFRLSEADCDRGESWHVWADAESRTYFCRFISSTRG